MKTTDNAVDNERLRQWQRARLASYGSGIPSFRPGPADVTVLAYFFRPEEVAAQFFPYVKCALFETWRHCGAMKTVIVSHAMTQPVAEFASRFPGLVEVQIEPSLRPRPPGDIDSMSADCNGRLHTRFSTKYVLIVQDDGFPLRSGLEDYLGKADFLGGPRAFVRCVWWVDLVRRVLHECPYNGGFSLRTNRICRLASTHWEKKWKNLHPSHETIEDVFYTTTLPRESLFYRLTVRANRVFLGYDFSIEGEYYPRSVGIPFGFHSAKAFGVVTQRHPDLLKT